MVHSLFYRLTLFIATLFAFTSIYAAAPMQKTQAPGYYRMMLGDFEITALWDGAIDLQPYKILTHSSKEQIHQLLTRSFETEAIPTSINAYLINTGTKLVLIDTGTGNHGLFGPALGKLANHIISAGYHPEDIDEIYITHMHADHIGGLVSEDKRIFPNAVVRIDQRDADYWLSPINAEKAPIAMKDFFKQAMDAFNPYIRDSKFIPFTENSELIPGIKSIAAHGHTPGHNVYLVESQGKKLLLWGDLMHIAAVQFPQPSATVIFDTDSQAAAIQRKKIYAQVAKEKYLVAGAHLPFPGIGHLRSEGEGYVFIPISYSPIKENTNTQK